MKSFDIPMGFVCFDSNHTKMLKGIALLLMLVHHTSMCPEWQSCSVLFQQYLHYQLAATKMCVYIFSFLIGYGFYFSKHRTLLYSVKRILMLLLPFWMMMLSLFFPAAYLSGLYVNKLENWGGWIDVVWNLFGISETLNWYSWFVCFYILTILFMPFLSRFYTRYPKFGWIFSIMLFYVISVFTYLFTDWQSNLFFHNFFIFTTNVPVVIVGYMCGFWNKQGGIPLWFEGSSRWWLSLSAILCILLFKALNISTMGFSLEAFYTPIFVFASLGILKFVKCDILKGFLWKVGDLSMYMWFFHAIFFTETVNLYTKYLVMEPYHTYLYTLFMTFVLTYVGSWCFQKLLTPIMNKIK